MGIGSLRLTPDRRAAAAAAAAATVIITMQLSGKSTRDALFISTFGVGWLPPMVISAALLSMLLTVSMARWMARSQPGRLVPRLILLSGAFFLAEWILALKARPAAAMLLYLHYTGLGAVQVSGFWAIVNERFDPRTARRTIGSITAGGSVGGLLGGLLPQWVGGSLSLTAMLPILTVLDVLAAGLVLQVARGTPSPEVPEQGTEGVNPLLPGSRILRASAYLMGLGLLVLLTSTAEGVLDYVFKARASATTARGEDLLRLFAAFYTVTALLGILIQVTLLRRVLSRLGIAQSAAMLPAGVSAGAIGAFFLPGLAPIMLARGVEVVLRNSLFRAAYELLFTPISPPEKRATKLLLDVGAARIGDIVGGGFILIALGLAAGAAGQVLLAVTWVLSLGALLVARQLNQGYVRALEGSLQRRAGQLPEAVEDDAAALLQTVGAFDLSGIRSRAAIFASSAMTPALSRPPQPPAPAATTPLSRAMASANPREVKDALAANPLKPDQVDLAIELLAWDDVAPQAISSLTAAAPGRTALLLQHLLDPDEEFAIRRRLVNVLATCKTVDSFEGLFQALDDRRFEVRYRAGRALSGMAGDIPGLRIDRDGVLRVVQREMAVDQTVWESRQLIDALDEQSSPMEAELVRDRANRSLEHLFTLLTLILPRDPLRLAFHGLYTGDSYLRGTALEYLETVLPEPIWAKLWPILAQGEPRPARTRNADQALEDLLASRQDIGLALTGEHRIS